MAYMGDITKIWKKIPEHAEGLGKTLYEAFQEIILSEPNQFLLKKKKLAIRPRKFSATNI